MGECGKSAKAIIVGLVLLVILGAAIILLLFFINKFNLPEHERHLDSEELYRLVQDPLTTNIKPLHHVVDLDLSSEWVSPDVFHFTGNQKIVLRIGNQTTKYITLDSRGLNVGNIKIFNFTAHPTSKPQPSKRNVGGTLGQVPLERWFLYPPTNRLVIVTSEPLLSRSLILLEMSFVGQLLTQERAPWESGLLKLQVADGLVLATGGPSKSQRGRMIFPCFDDRKFLSLFSLMVRHNSSFSALSSTDLASGESSKSSFVSTFKTTAPQTASSLALLLVAKKDVIVRKLLENPQQEVYILKSANLDDSRMENILKLINETYLKGLGNVSQKFVLFPRNEPGISSRGLISISDPISEDQIYKAWLGSILRIKESNCSWIEEGFKAQTFDMDEDRDPLAEDCAYRRLDQDNEDVRGKDRSFIANKARSILNFLDEKSSTNVFKKLLEKRSKEDEKYEFLRERQQIEPDWYNKSGDIQAKELLEKWHVNGEAEFNSTTFEEFLTEVDKHSKGFKDTINSWIESSDYPVLSVEFLKPETLMTIKQSGFHHPLINHVWKFPLEISRSGVFVVKNITAAEENITDMDPDRLVVVNPRRKVYGRVNYDSQYWIKLFNHLNTLTVATNKVLINDLFSLAWNGRIQYDIVFDSLRQLTTAEHWRAGKVLERKIRQIDFALRYSSLWDLWKKFINRLTGPIYDRTKGSLLNGLTKVACTHEHSLCIKDAHDLYLGNTNDQNTDLQEVALFEHGNKGNIVVNTISLEAAFVGRSLLLLDEKVRDVKNKKLNLEYFVNLYLELTQNFNIQRKLWDWFKRNIRVLQGMFTREEVAQMFEATVENLHGSENIDEAKRFWRSSAIYMDEIGHHRLQCKMDGNDAWMDRNQEAFKKWLKEK